MNYDEQANLLLIEGVVVGDDGEQIGKVGQVFTDDRTGRPDWVTVRTGWFGTRESFVPLDHAVLNGEQVRVPYDKDMVKGAPHYEVGDSLTEKEEDDLHRYYGMAETAPVTGAQRNATAPSTAGLSVAEGMDDGSGDTTTIVRSEEQLHVGTKPVEGRRARLHKFVVTEQQTVTLPVSHDQVRLIRESITDANRDQVLGRIDFAEEPQEILLTEDRVIVDKETVPVERVTLGTETVTEQLQVSAPVRAERIEIDSTVAPAGPGHPE